MKFIVKSIVHMHTGRVGWVYTPQQVPVLGYEYEADEDGEVIGMDARIFFMHGYWYWILGNKDAFRITF